MKQLKLIKEKTPNEFGGSNLVGRRKSKRPICTKRPIHLVLKSTRLGTEIKGLCFSKYGAKVRGLIIFHAKKSNARVYSLSVNSNHMHLAIRVRSRSDYQRFVRGLTAHLILSLTKTTGVNLRGLFDLRPFTRIVEWGRAFRSLLKYVEINNRESMGVVLRESKRRAPTLLQKSDKRFVTIGGVPVCS